MRFVSGRSRLPANIADISQRFQIMKVDRVSPQGTILQTVFVCIAYFKVGWTKSNNVCSAGRKKENQYRYTHLYVISFEWVYIHVVIIHCSEHLDKFLYFCYFSAPTLPFPSLSLSYFPFPFSLLSPTSPSLSLPLLLLIPLFVLFLSPPFSFSLFLSLSLSLSLTHSLSLSISVSSLSMDSLLPRPVSSSCASHRTPARPSWRRDCATLSTTAAPSTWTTTCSPGTPMLLTYRMVRCRWILETSSVPPFWQLSHECFQKYLQLIYQTVRLRCILKAFQVMSLDQPLVTGFCWSVTSGWLTNKIEVLMFWKASQVLSLDTVRYGQLLIIDTRAADEPYWHLVDSQRHLDISSKHRQLQLQLQPALLQRRTGCLFTELSYVDDSQRYLKGPQGTICCSQPSLEDIGAPT